MNNIVIRGGDGPVLQWNHGSTRDIIFKSQNELDEYVKNNYELIEKYYIEQGYRNFSIDTFLDFYSDVVDILMTSKSWKYIEQIDENTTSTFVVSTFIIKDFIMMVNNQLRKEIEPELNKVELQTTTKKKGKI